MKTLRRECRGPIRCAGVAAVEFVVAVPFLIFATLAVAELGRAFVQYDTLSYSVRNSARFVSENAIDGETGEVIISQTVEKQAKNLAIYGTIAAGTTPVLPDFGLGHISVLKAGSNEIEVVATYPYQPLLGRALPLFGGGTAPPLEMKIVVAMRAIS